MSIGISYSVSEFVVICSTQSTASIDGLCFISLTHPSVSDPSAPSVLFHGPLWPKSSTASLFRSCICINSKPTFINIFTFAIYLDLVLLHLVASCSIYTLLNNYAVMCFAICIPYPFKLETEPRDFIMSYTHKLFKNVLKVRSHKVTGLPTWVWICKSFYYSLPGCWDYRTVYPTPVLCTSYRLCKQGNCLNYFSLKLVFDWL